MDQNQHKEGDKVQVFKLECMYFITVYLWTTIGSNSMGGGGGADEPGTYVYNCIHIIYIYIHSAHFFTMRLHQTMVAAAFHYASVGQDKGGFN